MIGFFLYNRIPLFFICIFMIFFIHYVSSKIFRLNNIVSKLNTLDKLNMMNYVHKFEIKNSSYVLDHNNFNHTFVLPKDHTLWKKKIQKKLFINNDLWIGYPYLARSFIVNFLYEMFVYDNNLNDNLNDNSNDYSNDYYLSLKNGDELLVEKEKINNNNNLKITYYLRKGSHSK